MTKADIETAAEDYNASNVTNFPGSVNKAAEYRDRHSLHGGSGGDGGMSDLVARVASLEAHVDTIRQDIGVLKHDTRDGRDKLIKFDAQLDNLEKKVDHLPSETRVITIAFGLFAAIGGLIVAQQRIQEWLGLGPPPIP